MSLILEALRKSEADRHQESLPESLARQQALIHKAKKRAFYWPLLICVLLIINLVILGLFIIKPDFTAIVGDAGPQELLHARTMHPSVASAPEDNPLISEEARRVEAESVSAKTALSVARNLLAKSSPASSHVISDNPHHSRYSYASADSTRATDNQVWSAPSVPDPGQSVSTPELIAPAAQQNGREAPVQPNQSATITNSPSADLQKEKITSLTSVPHINELDRSFLGTLPKLVFNSHIYSRQAKGRRIMINDNYLREGERFSGITVIEITEEGVVLGKQGKEFMVPVVRDWSPAN